MCKNPVTEYVCSDCLEVCGDRVHQSPVLLDDQSILDKVKTLFPTQHRNVGKCARTRTHQWGSGFVNFLSTLSVGLGNDEIFWTSCRIEIMRVRSHVNMKFNRADGGRGVTKRRPYCIDSIVFYVVLMVVSYQRINFYKDVFPVGVGSRQNHAGILWIVWVIRAIAKRGGLARIPGIPPMGS